MKKIRFILAVRPPSPSTSRPRFYPRKVTWVPSALLHFAHFLADHFHQLGRRDHLRLISIAYTGMYASYHDVRLVPLRGALTSILPMRSCPSDESDPARERSANPSANGPDSRKTPMKSEKSNAKSSMLMPNSRTALTIDAVTIPIDLLQGNRGEFRRDCPVIQHADGERILHGIGGVNAIPPCENMLRTGNGGQGKHAHLLVFGLIGSP